VSWPVSPGPYLLVAISRGSLRVLYKFTCYGGLHNVSLFEYNIYRLLSWVFISMGLNPNISQGYQCHGPWQAYPCQAATAMILARRLQGEGEAARAVIPAWKLHARRWHDNLSNTIISAKQRHGTGTLRHHYFFPNPGPQASGAFFGTPLHVTMMLHQNDAPLLGCLLYGFS
jgi:hypothetical protein